MTSNPKMRKIIQEVRDHHDPIMTKSGIVMQEQNRTEQIRTEQNREAPEGLNHKAWDDYVQHRKDLRAKKLTERGARASMEKLAKLTPEEQQATVDLSISNGWAGLFPEKSPSAKPSYAEQLAAEMTAKGLR